MCEISRLNDLSFNGNWITYKKKKETIEDDQGKQAKNPLTVKSMFSLYDSSLVNGWIIKHTLIWWDYVLFIESLKWVCLLSFANIMGDV